MKDNRVHGRVYVHAVIGGLAEHSYLQRVIKIRCEHKQTREKCIDNNGKRSRSCAAYVHLELSILAGK